MENNKKPTLKGLWNKSLYERATNHNIEDLGGNSEEHQILKVKYYIKNHVNKTKTDSNFR